MLISVLVLGAGFWVLVPGSRVPGTEFQVPRSLNAELRTGMQNSEPRIRTRKPRNWNLEPLPLLSNSLPATVSPVITKSSKQATCLSRADADQVFNSTETWEKVIVQLRARAMPPPGSRRPDNRPTMRSLRGSRPSSIARRPRVRTRAARGSPSPESYGICECGADLLGVEIDGRPCFRPTGNRRVSTPTLMRCPLCRRCSIDI